ncbi:MAG TPA: Rad52/Rad22 family DNA repair protein [Ktedonobacteraceae bacterium]|nr:Rad52/Rad22 family DNA repair protein [Ktedonobacteraceae bacterium]
MEETKLQTQKSWEEISKGLREPFDPADVDFRVQGRVNEQTGRAQVVAYIDARMVQDRLDDVVGAGNWSFDWEPVVIDKGEVQVAKGTLTILGVSKADAGTASNFEQSLGAVSHCFKRAAVHWGVGRYLYDLPMSWVQVEKNGRISDQLLRELRSKLPVPEEKASSDNTRPRRSVAAARVSPVAAQTAPAAPPNAPAAKTAAAKGTDEPAASEQQLVSIRKLCVALGKPEPDSSLTYAEARQLISQLSTEYQRSRRAS